MLPLEQIARDYLRELEFDCEYYAPDPIPDTLVTVKRTARAGSSRFVGRAMLTIQAWAGTRGHAEKLCSDAVDALIGRGDYSAYGGLPAACPDITACTIENGPYRWDDPDVQDRRRWQATVAVDYNA